MNHTRFSALVFLTLTGCAQVLDIEDTVQATNKPVVIPDNVSCRGTPPVKRPPFMAHLTVTNFLSGQALDGIQVKTCAGTDPGCQAPLGTFTTSDGGKVDVPINQASNFAYLRIEGSYKDAETNKQVTIKTTHYYGTRLFEKSDDKEITVGPDTFFDDQILGGKGDPERGYLTFEIHDCDEKTLTGATLSASTADDRSTLYFLADNGFTTALNQTNESGRGAIFSLPQGNSNLSFSLVDGDISLDPNGFSINITPNIVTTVVATPR